MELWSIAQECWSQNPWARPSFPDVLNKLNTFARMEGITPFALREPKQMQVIGEQYSWFLLTAYQIDGCKANQPKLRLNGNRSRRESIIRNLKRHRLHPRSPHHLTRPSSPYVAYRGSVMLLRRFLVTNHGTRLC